MSEEQAGPDFSGVAAEDAATSVEHEHEVVEEIDALDPGAADGDEMPDQLIDDGRKPEASAVSRDAGPSIGSTTPPL